MDRRNTDRRDTIAIVGVGLIGGSIGLAIRRRGLARQVVGVGRRRASLRKAQQCGAVTRGTTSLARGVAEAELVIVCTPVQDIVQHVREAARHCPPGALITDVGSTKAQIVAQLEEDLGSPHTGSRKSGSRVTYVGSHPLAGGEKQGPQHARADLLEERIVVVTPTRRTRGADVLAIEQFWESLGARVVKKSPAAHDAAVASTSHVPHVVASVLAASTAPTHLPLVSSGWLDCTRVASGDAELWRQILSDNRPHVLKSLDKFAKVLSSIRQALEVDDQGKILRLLEAGKRHRDSVGS